MAKHTQRIRRQIARLTSDILCCWRNGSTVLIMATELHHHVKEELINDTSIFVYILHLERSFSI